MVGDGFQFLGIPPKGELVTNSLQEANEILFPISRDPPEGGTRNAYRTVALIVSNNLFPISRDPPEGGTFNYILEGLRARKAEVSNF